MDANRIPGESRKAEFIRPTLVSSAIAPGRNVKIILGILAYLVYITPPMAAWTYVGIVGFLYALLWPAAVVIAVFYLAVGAIAPVWASTLGFQTLALVWLCEILLAAVPVFVLRRYVGLSNTTTQRIGFGLYGLFAIGNLVMLVSAGWYF